MLILGIPLLPSQAAAITEIGKLPTNEPRRQAIEIPRQQRRHVLGRFSNKQESSRA